MLTMSGFSLSSLKEGNIWIVMMLSKEKKGCMMKRHSSHCSCQCFQQQHHAPSQQALLYKRCVVLCLSCCLSTTESLSSTLLIPDSFWTWAHFNPGLNKISPCFPALMAALHMLLAWALVPSMPFLFLHEFRTNPRNSSWTPSSQNEKKVTQH